MQIGNKLLENNLSPVQKKKAINGLSFKKQTPIWTPELMKVS